MLSHSDGLFREIGQSIASDYPEIEFETFIIDDSLCRTMRPRRGRGRYAKSVRRHYVRWSGWLNRRASWRPWLLWG